jgi:hypothetical protein
MLRDMPTKIWKRLWQGAGTKGNNSGQILHIHEAVKHGSVALELTLSIQK